MHSIPQFHDFKQNHPFSCDLFNFVMESVLRKVGGHRNGCTKRDVTAAFSAIERESTKIALAVNEGKTKYMFPTSRDVRCIDSLITVDNNTFDTVKEFVYLGSAVTNKNYVNLEIKRRITLANRCCNGLNGQLSNRDLSRATKLILPCSFYP